MKKLFSVLKYTKDYKGYTALNIVCNIFFAIFSVFSISLTIPFLELIFKDDTAKLQKVVAKGLPHLSLSLKGISEWGHYQMCLMVVEQGKAQTILVILIVVFIATLFKNLSRYFAMYFLAPIRNGVVKDLRNKMIKNHWHYLYPILAMNARRYDEPHDHRRY
ncbi:MAG: hypothetical protein IPH32_02355 [Bacteroidetes bacterium]|nr:hypothetical protein [Bacteroidota bacterium]